MTRDYNLNHKRSFRGFTLLELLIVIAIIGVLTAIIIIVINPAEILKKGRDVQRMSDLSSLKTAIALYLTDASSPDLDGNISSCSDKIFVSIDSGATMTKAAPPGYSWARVSSANLYKVDATGWIPVNLTSVSGGSPIASLPIDPINTDSATASGRYYYTYYCDNTNLWFELNARLESSTYATDKSGKDGGNQSDIYEVGNDPGLDLPHSSGALGATTSAY